MGCKVFVSYKHSDNSVCQLRRSFFSTTVRDYVNELELMIGKDNIYKGEHDDEDLSNFKDPTIESHLRDKIFDSSVTLVVISPNMKDINVPESDQWIPWEVAYSLREQSRRGRISSTNATLAVVLPDRYGSYTYYLEEKNCCSAGCLLFKTNTLFQILRENMFNERFKSRHDCVLGGYVYIGECSYIPSIKWINFVGDVEGSLNRARRINKNIGQYDIVKRVL